jgi:uncharacterized protein with HEPN domain
MRPDQRDAAYLWDMVDAARNAIEFTRGKALDDFVQDRMAQYAVERAVEIIGEAANRVSSAFHQAHPEIPWRKIVGQRNVLAHEYGDVDPSMMWDLVRLHLPVLVQQLERLIPPDEREDGAPAS